MSLQPCLVQRLGQPIFSRFIERKFLYPPFPRELGIDPQDFCTLGARLIFATRYGIRNRQANMGKYVIGRKLNCFLKCRNRLLKSPRIPECLAEVAI